MNREELIRLLASGAGSADTPAENNEAERQFVRDLLAGHDDRLAQAINRLEVSNPTRPGPISAEDGNRDFIRQLFGRAPGEGDLLPESPSTNQPS